MAILPVIRAHWGTGVMRQTFDIPQAVALAILLAWSGTVSATDARLPPTTPMAKSPGERHAPLIHAEQAAPGKSPESVAAPSSTAAQPDAAAPAIQPTDRPGLPVRGKPGLLQTRDSAIAAALANPCTGRQITQIFPAEITAGESFVILGCGFGEVPVAVVDAATSTPLRIDYWSEQVIQAWHPERTDRAQLRVLSITGDATAAFPVTMTSDAPILPGGLDIRILDADVLVGVNAFEWDDANADEHIVECRAVGLGLAPDVGLFTERARASRTAPPAGDPHQPTLHPSRQHDRCTAGSVCWRVAGAELFGTATPLPGDGYACRVKALSGGKVQARSHYVAGRWVVVRNDQTYLVDWSHSWERLLLQGEILRWAWNR
jgi:hypothetical protein